MNFLMGWQYAAYALVAGLMLGYVKGCTDEKERFDSFKASVEAVGKAQEAATKARIANNKKAKEEIDAQNVKALAGLSARLADARRRLREYASRSVVPAAPTTSGRPQGEVCYDNAELGRRVDEALRTFQERTLELIRRGEEAMIDRKSWSDWSERVE